MPVSFLSATQRERYARYPETLSSEELTRYFHLDDDDREWIATKRRYSSRLGYALQLTTVRFLGTFLEYPTAVPEAVLRTLATQLNIPEFADCVAAYRRTRQRWQHTTEIRARYAYSEFTDTGNQFHLGRWLCALCWTGTDRPSVLFEHANSWLIGHKVLLPGVTLLERFVAEVRSRMESRLWRLLTRDVTDVQRQRLDDLLDPVEGSRQSWLDRLRKGPVRVVPLHWYKHCCASKRYVIWESNCLTPRCRPVASGHWHALPAQPKSQPWPDFHTHGAWLPWCLLSTA
ncbi:hypothetical protein ALP42_200021 [Pseudomonas savastanoi pv. nerii]|uniref:DUF4158 domain-containing protein n=1 Tax=Pseudomonas savastanoi pv. nerii TaxID=360921 RepID=A0AB74BIN5_PSESS|nr:hypothetical protein ALP42_200021 [Pseudomonas savastanoi pv. nerii]